MKERKRGSSPLLSAAPPLMIRATIMAPVCSSFFIVAPCKHTHTHTHTHTHKMVGNPQIILKRQRHRYNTIDIVRACVSLCLYTSARIDTHTHTLFHTTTP